MFLPEVKRSHRNINFTVDQDNESSPEVSLAVPLKTISFKNTKPEIIQAIEKAFYDELFLLEGESCLRGELRDKIEEVEAVARENIGIEADESSEEYEDECALGEEEWNLSVSGLVKASTLPLLLSFSHIPLEFKESSYPITRKEYDEIEAYKKIYDCKQISTMSCCEVEEKIKAILKQEFPWVISPDFMDDCGLSMYELLPSRYMPFLNSENNFIPVTEEKYELDMKKKLQYMIECYQERIKYKEDSESLEERKEKCKKWFCNEFESNISCMENKERKLNACSKEDNMMMLEFEKFACHQNFCHENVSREKRCLTMMLYNNLIAMSAFIACLNDFENKIELKKKLEGCILLVEDKILLQLAPLYAWYDKESEVYKIFHSRLLNLRACIEGKGEYEVDEKCKLHVIDEEKLKKEQEKYCNGFYIAENAKGEKVSFYEFDEFKAKIMNEVKFEKSSDKKQHSFVNKIRESFKECLKNEPDYWSRVAQQITTQVVFGNWFPWYEAQGEGSECIRKNKEIIGKDNQIALINKLHVALVHEKENLVEDTEKMNNNELVTLLSLSMCQSEVCQKRIFSEHDRKMAMHCCESARREEEWRFVKKTKQIVDEMIAKINEGPIQDEKKIYSNFIWKKEFSNYLKYFAKNNYPRVWSTRNNLECEIKKYANTLKYLEGKDDVALKFDYYDDKLEKKTYEFKVCGDQSQDSLTALLKDIISKIPQKYWYRISDAFMNVFGICFSKPYLTDLFKIVQEVLGSENMNFYEDKTEKILSEEKEINYRYEELQKSVYSDFIEKYEELYFEDNRYAENEKKFKKYYDLLKTFFEDLSETKEYTIFKKSCLNSLLTTYKWFGLDYVKEEDHQNNILKLIEKIWKNMQNEKNYSQTVLFFAWIYHCLHGFEKMALNELSFKEVGGELENAFKQFWCLNNEVLFKKLHYEKEKKYLEKIELPSLADITDCLSGCLERLKQYSSFKDCDFPQINMSQINSSYWEESKNVIQFAKKLVKYKISVTGIELENCKENLSENLKTKPEKTETKPAAVVLQSPQPEHSAWMEKFIEAIKTILKIAGVGGLLFGGAYLLSELWLNKIATSG